MATGAKLVSDATARELSSWKKIFRIFFSKNARARHRLASGIIEINLLTGPQMPVSTDVLSYYYRKSKINGGLRGQILINIDLVKSKDERAFLVEHALRHLAGLHHK